MATTKEQQDKNQEDFSAAFNEPDQAPADQSEDQAFGIAAEDGQDEGGAEGSVPTESVANDGAPEGSPAEEATESPAVEAQEQAAGEGDQPGQAEKSWEGRLNKREAELKAREDALRGKEPTGESPAEDAAEGGEGAEDPEAKLAEDFGPEFVKLIVAIASKKAAEAAGSVVKDVDSKVEAIISHIQDSGTRDHFEKLQDAHPDFSEVADSPEFQKWLSTRTPEEQAADKQILESGRAREIIALLHQYKAAAASNSDDSEANAEGVPGGGIRLPTSPAAGSDDYAKAWEEA